MYVGGAEGDGEGSSFKFVTQTLRGFFSKSLTTPTVDMSVRHYSGFCNNKLNVSIKDYDITVASGKKGLVRRKGP